MFFQEACWQWRMQTSWSIKESKFDLLTQADNIQVIWNVKINKKVIISNFRLLIFIINLSLLFPGLLAFKTYKNACCLEINAIHVFLMCLSLLAHSMSVKTPPKLNFFKLGLLVSLVSSISCDQWSIIISEFQYLYIIVSLILVPSCQARSGNSRCMIWWVP